MDLHISPVMCSAPSCEVTVGGIVSTPIPEESTSHNGEAHSDLNRHIMELLRFVQVL